jgi:hypothetical protein
MSISVRCVCSPRSADQANPKSVDLRRVPTVGEYVFLHNAGR